MSMAVFNYDMLMASFQVFFIIFSLNVCDRVVKAADTTIVKYSDAIIQESFRRSRVWLDGRSRSLNDPIRSKTCKLAS